MSTDSPRGFVKLFDDFVGDAIDTFLWTANADTGGTSAIAEDENGVLRLASDGTDGDINNLFGANLWRPSDAGPLIFEARVRASSLSAGFFVGLSDSNSDDEVPIDLDGGTLTTTATDAVGFVLDSAEVAANWQMCSVKADADGAQTATPTRLNAVASTYQTLRLVVNADGDVVFYINGEEVGRRSAAVTTSVNFVPAIAVLANGTATNFDVDYVYVCSGRSD